MKKLVIAIYAIVLCLALTRCTDHYGVNGVNGKDGVDGQTGAQGQQGEKGDKGDPGVNGTNGLDGAQGAPGNNGVDGAQGPQGEQGQQGIPGINGIDGQNGQDATPVKMVQLCAGYTPSYPSTFPEFAECLDNQLYAVYWDGHNAWLAYIPDGYYSSTSTSAPCNFTVIGCEVK